MSVIKTSLNNKRAREGEKANRSCEEAEKEDKRVSR